MTATAQSLGSQLAPWGAVPFIGLLVAISILELFAQRWWNSLLNKAIVVGLATAAAAVHLIGGHGAAGGEALLHSMTDYVSFILLLFAVFVISTGIQVALAAAPTSRRRAKSTRATTSAFGPSHRSRSSSSEYSPP